MPRGRTAPAGTEGDRRPGRRHGWVTVTALAILVVGAVTVVGRDTGPEASGGPAAVEVAFPDDPPPANATEPAGTAGATARDWPVCRGGSGPVDCVRWRLSLRPHERDAVVAAHGRLLTAATDGTLRGYHLSGGRPRWVRHLDGGDGAAVLLPVVAGTVPVVHGDRTTVVDLDTGAAIGGFDAPAPDAAQAVSPWLVTREGSLVVARSVTGDIAWEIEVAPTTTALLTAAGALLSGADGRLTRLSTTTGRERWTVELPAPVTHATTVDGTTLVVTGAETSELVAIDSPSGGIEWRLGLDGQVRWLTAEPGEHLGAAVVATRGGDRVVVVELRTGALLADSALAERASGTLPPAVRGEVVAAAHAGPRPGLTIVDVAGGRASVRRVALDRWPRRLAFAGRDLLAVADGTGVAVWDVRAGTRRWRAPLGSSSDLVLGEPLLVVGDRGVVALYAQP